MAPTFSTLREEDRQVIINEDSVRRGLPGGPVVKTLLSSAEVVSSILDRGTKIPHASRPKNQNIGQKQYYNKFNKALKMVHIKTKS